jgi:predicted LPLAT superfamily acyltransferase
VAAYFFAVRPRQRAAAADFLGRILGRKPYAWERLRHFYIFSRVSADRLYLLAGELDRLRIRVHGRELLERISASRRGCVVLSSHLGSFEATRAASLLDERVDLHVVIDRGVNPTFTHYL